MERDLLTYPTWERYTVLSNAITNLSIKERRHIFQAIRKEEASQDSFFPAYGFTLSEFAVWHVLGDSKRSHAKKGKKKGDS